MPRLCHVSFNMMRVVLAGEDDLTVAKTNLMCVLFFPILCIVVNVIYGSIFANVSKKLNRHFRSYNSFKMWSSIHLSFVLRKANLGLA